MHHCLCIQEVVHNIACHGTGRDLVSMALACRAFYEPAMDNMWRDLPGMGPLIGCLPETFWEVVEADEAEEYGYHSPVLSVVSLMDFVSSTYK